MKCDNEELYLGLLRTAADELRNARIARELMVHARKTALLDVLSQAERHLESVDIHAKVHGDTVVLSAHEGEHGVDVCMNESTDHLTVRGATDESTIPIRWVPRLSQWVGRDPGNRGPSEPAWFTVAKKVLDELAQRALEA